MTPLEMLDEATRPSDVPGVERSSFMTFVIPYRRHRGRIQVLKGRPSLYGEVVGSRAGGRIGRAHDHDPDGATLIVSVQRADVVKWMTAHLTTLEGAAIEAAEAGDHEKAKHLLEQYTAVRDRLSITGARGNL